MSVSTSLEAAPRPFACLIVEDDPAFAAMAAQVVREEGGAPQTAPTIAAARVAAAQTPFELVLLDNHLPDGTGYAFFEQLARRNPDAPIVMITGMPDLGEAVSLTRNGLFEYLTKPISVETLAACMGRAKLRLQARAEPEGLAGWFGQSPAMRDVMQQLRQAARYPASTVLFTGETGTGKDLAARLLHQLACPGATVPFVAVNCSALPAEMFESELFGAERGAYTGAEKKRGGLVAAAAKGTLFLDEIAEVPLALQAKLLRLLESREYRSLGSAETTVFDGRFVAATNKNLAAEVQAGRFRQDLLYRLDVMSVELPPLRQRRADIPGLAESLLGQLAKKYGRTRPLLKPEDLEKLSSHDFPGNVRELRNILERSLLKTADHARWLALDVASMLRSLALPPAASVPGAIPVQAAQGTEPVRPERNLSPIEAQEYRLIRDTLRETQGGIRRAAGKLGMSPQALLRRLERWPELRVGGD